MTVELFVADLMHDRLLLGVFVLGGCILLSSAFVTLAIVIHANTLCQLAQVAAHDHAANTTLCDANWRWVVQHIAADALNESIDGIEVIAFSGMTQGRISEIRFVLRDGRALVFATQCRIVNCYGWGRRLRLQRHANAIGQLFAVWNYFAQITDQALPLPCGTAWFVMPLQAQQQRHLLRPPARSVPARPAQRKGGAHA